MYIVKKRKVSGRDKENCNSGVDAYDNGWSDAYGGGGDQCGVDLYGG